MTESQVKAAFLYNFASFVVWPGPSDGPLVIGIAGDDAFAEIVGQVVRGRKVNNREFQTRRVKSADDPSGCHMLYVGVMRPHDAAELMERVRGPVLTVGETPSSCATAGWCGSTSRTTRCDFRSTRRTRKRRASRSARSSSRSPRDRRKTGLFQQWFAR